MPVGELLLVNGFRTPDPGLDPPPWHEYFADQLLDSVSKDAGGATTSDSEDVLGIEASVYWYVSSPHLAYTGGVLSLWQAVDVKDAIGGLCPFDSGGMAQGRIETDPPLNPPERPTYFHNCDRPLTEWPACVSDALQASYADLGRYVDGLAPSPKMTPRDHSRNGSSQAWTWEARVGKTDDPYTRTQVSVLIWPEERRGRFFHWLLEQEDDIFDRITEKVERAEQRLTPNMIEVARQIIKAVL